MASEKKAAKPIKQVKDPKAVKPTKPAAPTPAPVGVDELQRLVEGRHHDPHSILGPHPHAGGVTVRTLRPWATSVVVVAKTGAGESRTELAHEHGGIFVGVLDLEDVPDYRLEIAYGGDPATVDDPYRFLPTLGDMDLHLIGEGRHETLWTVLGAHEHVYPSPLGDIHGTAFAVWAPSALGVRVVGDHNHWDGTGTPMRSLGSSGVWELFVPDVGSGSRYKFAVLGRDGVWRTKADPLAQHTEHPPATASVVFSSAYEWGDESWLTARRERDPYNSPMSTYEVHLGSWRPGLGYAELADELTAYVTEMGFTHVELMPVMEHPYAPSWGYQVTSYYAPTSRFGSPDEFRHLVDRLHQAGIGVILDWVPAHFPKDEWALARFDGTPLYEHADPRRGEQPDWGTYVFDFGRREVRNFLVANATYWLEEFHVDGLRVDAVASMLYLDYSRKDGEWSPNVYGGRENLEAVSFIQEANATAYKRSPGVLVIAEESTAWPGVTRPTHLGGLGFGLKWNMGWMNDTLHYVSREPIHRQWHHHEMTFALVYAWSEQYCLPISHDEVVHGKGSLIGKMPGDHWQKLANLRAYLAFMWAHPGKQLLFMGSEFAQYAEWSEGRGLDWWLLDNADHRGVQQCLADMNRVYKATPALWQRDNDPGGFEWIDADDSAGNTFSWLRWGHDGAALACIANFSGGPHESYRVGLPYGGTWTEVLNTDAEVYGGSGVGNMGAVQAEEIPWHGRPFSATVRVPPLGALWLRPSLTVRRMIVDLALARRLVDDQVVAWDPSCAADELREVGRGWDNVIVRVGARLVLRLPLREQSAPLIENEARWLASVAAPLAVRAPVPLLVGVPTDYYPWPWIVTEWIDGIVVADLPVDGRSHLVDDLADSLLALHRPAPRDAPSNLFRGVPLAERDEMVRARMLVHDGPTDVLLRIWEAALAAPPWSGPALWLHGDPHSRNMVSGEHGLAGLIDFGDLTSGDPANDLATAWWTFSLADRARFVARVDAAGRYDEHVWTRAAGWAAAFASAILPGTPLTPVAQHTAQQLTLLD